MEPRPQTAVAAEVDAAQGRALGRAWPALFAVSLANALFLVVGSVVLVYTVDLHAPTVFEASFYLTVLLLLGTSWPRRRGSGVRPARGRAAAIGITLG